jgi:hypothetical protein
VPQRVPVAAHAALVALTVLTVVCVTVFLVASAPADFWSNCFCLGTLGGEEPKGGSHQRSAAQLYRLAARDRTALQSRGKVIEGAKSSFISVGQQRKSSFLRLPSR